jgi:thioester reductase-like protein
VSSILFTGFPGFLGRELLPGVLKRAPGRSAVCLVQRRYADLAAHRTEELVTDDPSLAGRIHLQEGDIAEPGLGMTRIRRIERETTEIYHLAAVYDLEVSRQTGIRVNVEGTRRILRFAERCPRLERLHYVSTCYVSGRYDGTFRESDLDVGQSFNNHYEETKFLAEVEVRAAVRGGLPATVYRPAIVVGDSRTGVTQKYDGPYYLIRFLLRQPRFAVMPVVGDPMKTRVTLAPSDAVIAAITFLSGHEVSAGQVYQLADPDPPTVNEMMHLLERATRKRLLRLRFPVGLAKGALRASPIRRATGIPAALVDYFNHPTIYSTERARADLDGSGIEIPTFSSYAERLVSFVAENPDVGSEAMA